jgi:phosphoglycerate kinase
MKFRRLKDADARGKTALVRVDFNVPMQDGKISDDTRLRAALPTIQALNKAGAKVALLAHFDRPKGERVPEMSLKPVAPALAALLDKPVSFADDCIGTGAQRAIDCLGPTGVILLENTRFHAGEEKNDSELAKQIAALGDFYVNDAFSAAHRAHASTEGLAKLLPAYAGKQMEQELDALEAALGKPKRPVIGIVGGAKVSTKIELLENLVGKLDALVIGGAMANTFLHAQGHAVGASLYEADFANTAREIIAAAAKNKCEIILPLDVIVADDLKPGVATATRALSDVRATDKIFDVGPKSLAAIETAIAKSATLIWNGPLGVFETPPFDTGTVAIAKLVAQRAKDGQLIAVAGGGDTVAALNHAGVTADLTFVSTAGGAFLEWMEGKALPGVEALKA